MGREPRVVVEASSSTSLWQQRRLQIWCVCVATITGVLLLQTVFPLFPSWINSSCRLGAGAAMMVFLAALLCEFIDSSMGMGYGTTLTPLLLLAGFDPLQIVPAVLLSEFVTGMAACLLHQRDGNVDFLRNRTARKTAVLLSLLSVAGSVLAVMIAVRASKGVISAAIACMILAVGLVILATARRQIRYRPGHILVLGGVAAFNKALSGGGYGPLVTGGQVVSGIPARSAVAITSLAESFTCLVGVILYMATVGQLFWPLVLPLLAGAILSVPIATLMVKRVSDHHLRTAVGVITSALGILMILKFAM